MDTSTLKSITENGSYLVEIPAVSIRSDDTTISRVYEVERHIQHLNMQCYALLILEMFAETEGFLSISVSAPEDDAYIAFEDAVFDEGVDGDDTEFEGWFEKLNDMRDDGSMKLFVDALVKDGEWSKDTIEETIAKAYDAMAAGHSAPRWKEVSALRDKLLLQEQSVKTMRTPSPRRA